jgi:hypothetical protein
MPRISQSSSRQLLITGALSGVQYNDIFATVFPTNIMFGVNISCNNFTLSGRTGALVNIVSSVGGTARVITKVGGGTVSCNYLSIQDSTPSGGTWYAGPNSTLVSNVGIWSATQAPNSNMMDIV